MDSFELNKVAGAVLGTLLFAMGSGFVAELIYTPKPAGTAGYALPEPEPKSGGEAAAAPKAEPIAVRLASADATKGQGGTKACQACHSFEKGGPNKVGPDLYDVVERQKAHHEGFDYSAALKEKGGSWTYEDLDHFLESPKGYAKGTKMAFAGISGPQERANVIAYLRTLSDSPKPLPVAEKKDESAKEDGKKEEGKKEEDAKPAEKAKDEAKGDAKPESGTDSKTPTKAADTQSKESTPVEGKDTAREVPAPEAQPERNETAPTQAPEAKPAGDVPTAKPGGEGGPNATTPPAQANPEAEKKAREAGPKMEPKNSPEQNTSKPADAPAEDKPTQQ